MFFYSQINRVSCGILQMFYLLPSTKKKIWEKCYLRREDLALSKKMAILHGPK